MAEKPAPPDGSPGGNEGDDPLRLSVVMPVYNERVFLPRALKRVQDARVPGVRKTIIVVDDGSTDGTREMLQQLRTRKQEGRARSTIRHSEPVELDLDSLQFLFSDRNRGKGAALRRGFRHAEGDVVVIQDADLEYDPQDFSELLKPIRAGEADVVFGSRFLGGPHRVLYFWHYMGNRMLTFFSNMLTNLNLTDMETCYKMFRREVLEEIEIQQNRFGVEPELTAKVARMGCRIYEVPISYYGRTYEEGKKITWVDGLKALWCILRYNLGSRGRR